MVTKTVSSKGEIVIPKKIREKTGIELESEVDMTITLSGILISPKKREFHKLAGLLTKNGVNDMDELDATFNELMAGIYD